MWHQLHTFLLHTSRIVLLLYVWVCAGSKQLFCDWGPQQECYIATDIWAFYGQQQQGVLMVRNVFSVFWLIWMQKIIGPACVVINILTKCPILHINTPGPWGGLLDSHLESVFILNPFMIYPVITLFWSLKPFVHCSSYDQWSAMKNGKGHLVMVVGASGYLGLYIPCPKIL